MEFLRAVTTDDEDVMINPATIVKMIMIVEGKCRIWTTDGETTDVKARDLDDLFGGNEESGEDTDRKDYLLAVCCQFIEDNDFGKVDIMYDGEMQDGANLSLDMSIATDNEEDFEE